MICKVTKAPMYVYLFDKHSGVWTGDKERDRFFLMSQQDYMNEVLKHRRIVFLNEVLDILGLPRTKRGQVVGWTYDEHNPTGDNYIDFGFGDVCQRKGVNGAIVLNFNVDGDILDKLGEKLNKIEEAMSK